MSPKRDVDRAQLRTLGTCQWLAAHANIVITGATGTGKTYLACALAQQTCRVGRRALYRRVPRLLEELALAHADGTYTRLLGRLAKIDVLVFDDWGLAPLREQERRDILEILETATPDGGHQPLAIQPLPWVGEVTHGYFRVGMESALTRRWQKELATLYRVTQALWMAHAT